MIDTDKKHYRTGVLGDIELRVSYDDEPGSQVYVQYLSPTTTHGSSSGYELWIAHEDLAAFHRLLTDAVADKGSFPS